MSEEVKSEIGWDEWALGLARHWALRSKDPSTKVGAVIIGLRKTDVAGGYNGLPPRIPDLQEYLNNRDRKYPLIIHAERNALDHARFDTTGATIYVTRHPCSECAKSIVNKGINRVVYEINDEYEARVAEDLKVAARTFALAGVTVEGKRL